LADDFGAFPNYPEMTAMAQENRIQMGKHMTIDQEWSTEEVNFRPEAAAC
jgi:hypothetical protein